MSTIKMHNLIQSLFVKPGCAKQCPISLTEKLMGLRRHRKTADHDYIYFPWLISNCCEADGRQASLLFWITFKSQKLTIGWNIRLFNSPSILIRKEFIIKARKTYILLYGTLKRQKCDWNKHCNMLPYLCHVSCKNRTYKTTPISEIHS